MVGSSIAVHRPKSGNHTEFAKHAHQYLGYPADGTGSDAGRLSFPDHSMFIRK